VLSAVKAADAPPSAVGLRPSLDRAEHRACLAAKSKMKRVVVAVEQEHARINHGLPYFAELDAHN
jgi:hypothetical protein